MKQIDNSFNTSTVAYGWAGKKSVDFMQNGIAENTAAVIESLLGAAYDPTKSYIMKGCVKTSTGGTTSISAGYIYGISKALGSMAARTYVYEVVAQSFADPTGSDVVVGTVTAVAATYDPVNFSDGSTHSIHNTWRVTFTTGASGSGDVNYSDLLFFNPDFTVATAGTNWDNSVAPVTRFKKDPVTGYVHLTGRIAYNGPTPSSPSTVLFTLPAGNRPVITVDVIAGLVRTAGPTIEICVLTISSAGGVRWFVAESVDVGDIVILEGITFPTT